MTAGPPQVSGYGGTTADRLFLELADCDEAEFLSRLDQAGVSTTIREEVLYLRRVDSACRREESAVLRAEDPRQIGGYPVRWRIGQGGYGLVLAVLQPPGAFAALKVFRPDLARNGSDRAAARFRFQYDARILAGLRGHQHVVTLFDCDLDGDEPFYVMELVLGPTLLDYGSIKALGLRERLLLFRDLCTAVEWAHANRVVHGDLKPANVLVQDRVGPSDAADVWRAPGIVKVIDFGAATSLLPPSIGGELAAATAAPMTLAYASPEQRKGKVPTATSDEYALGVILTEMLTGRRPFAGVAGEDTTRPPPPSTLVEQAGNRNGSVTHARPPGDPVRLRRRLARDLDHVALKALSHDPAGRYADVTELRRDIDRYLAGDAVTANPSRLYRVGKCVDKHRSAVGVAAGIVVLGGLLTAWAVAEAATARSSERNAEEHARVAAADRDAAREAAAVAERERATTAAALATAKTNLSLADRAISEFRESVAQATGPHGQPWRHHGLRKVSQLRAELATRSGDMAARFKRGVSLMDLARMTEVLWAEAAAIPEFEEARKIFAELYDADKKNKHCQSWLAGCEESLGALYLNVNRPADAEAAYKRAITHRTALANAPDADPREADGLRRDIVACHNGFGMMYADGYRRTGNDDLFRRAASAYKEAVAVLEGVGAPAAELSLIYVNFGNLYAIMYSLSATPADRLRAFQQADQYYALADKSVGPAAQSQNPADVAARAADRQNRANLYQLAQDLGRAASLFGEAADLYAEALQLEPNVLKLLWGRAECLFGKGTCLLQSKQADKAKAEFLAAIPLLERVSKAAPTRVTTATYLGGAHCNLANIYQGVEGNLAAAATHYTHAIAELKDFATDPTCKSFLYNSHIGRANVRSAAGKAADAVTDWDAAIRLAPNDAARHAPRAFRALSLAKAGQTEKAVEQLRALSSPAAADAAGYAAAAAWSVATAAVQSQPELAEEYAERAVKTLVGLRDKGYFHAPAIAEQLTRDPDFLPIKDNKGFQSIIQSLKMSKQ